MPSKMTVSGHANASDEDIFTPRSNRVPQMVACILHFCIITHDCEESTWSVGYSRRLRWKLIDCREIGLALECVAEKTRVVMINVEPAN